VEQADFARTITIPTLGISSTDLDITPEQAEALYRSGRTAAEDFLASWDFAGYIAAFRTGKPHSRRRQVAEQMRRAAGR
jgi:NTE family protein